MDHLKKLRRSAKSPEEGMPREIARGRRKSGLSRCTFARTVSKTASLCLLPTCRKPFVQKKLSGRLGGRRREFCSPDCKDEFFQLARRVGAALLKRAVTDPEAENWVRDLRREAISQTDGDEL